MKKDYSLVIAIIACLLVVVCLFQISDLKEQIFYLENNLSVRLIALENEQNSTLNYIEQKMEEQASLLTKFDCTPESVNVDARTVKLHCNIIPKEHAHGVTETILTVNGNEIAMEFKNGEYVLETDIPLFETSTISKVVFNENGMSRTEALDWSINPRHDFLPSVDADFSGSGHGKRASNKSNTYIWHKEGELNIHADCYERTFEVESITLVEEIDGVETNRTNIPLSTESLNEEMAAEVQAVQEDNYKGSSYHFYHEIDRDFEIPFGSTMELYVELVDDDGLVYRVCIEHWEIAANGESIGDEDWYYVGFDANIYDEKGNILYNYDDELEEVY